MTLELSDICQRLGLNALGLREGGKPFINEMRGGRKHVREQMEWVIHP